VKKDYGTGKSAQTDGIAVDIIYFSPGLILCTGIAFTSSAFL